MHDRVIIDGSGHQPIKGYRKIIVTVHLMSFLKKTKLVENLMSKMIQADGVTSQEVQSFIADMLRASRKSFPHVMSQANLLRLNLNINNPVFFVLGAKNLRPCMRRISYWQKSTVRVSVPIFQKRDMLGYLAMWIRIFSW